MNLLLNIIFTSLALIIATYVVPGASMSNLLIAVLAAVILGIVNTLIKPIVIILTLPINILTLGLFTFVVNALMIMLVAGIVPGFEINGFWNALLFSIVVSILKIIFNRFDR